MTNFMNYKQKKTEEIERSFSHIEDIRAQLLREEMKEANGAKVNTEKVHDLTRQMHEMHTEKSSEDIYSAEDFD